MISNKMKAKYIYLMNQVIDNTEPKTTKFTRFKNWVFSIIPPYGLLAVAIMLSFNFTVYMGTRLFTTGMDHINMTLPIDDMIPFVSAFIVVYIPVSFGSWIFGYILVARQEKMTCFRICASEMIAKFICLICFIVIPTTMVRPEITGHGFFDWATALVYKIDPADNLFPSIHCLESYVLARTMPWLKDVPRWYRILVIPVALLVFASTLLVKQHVIVDVAAAIVVVEIGIFITGIIKRKRASESKTA